MTDPEAAADAFDALSDPTRVAILRKLVTRFHRDDGHTVGFAELRRAVGVDDPGRFNYHLDTLAPRFVAKHDEGYSPTVAGRRAVESAESGVYAESAEPRSGTVDYDCPECGEALTAAYENRHIGVSCDDHGTIFLTLVDGSIGTAGSLLDVIDYAVREMWRRLDRISDGVCHVCRAPALSLSFRESDGVVLADCSCEECYFEETNGAVLFALTHPAALAVLHAQGVDVPEQLPFEPLDDRMERGRFVDDGSAVEFTVAPDGEAVTIRVHDDLTVEAV